MIAIALFSMCIVPLVEIPLKALRREVLTLERLPLERLSLLSFAEIKTQLYAKSIPWKHLTQEKKERVLLSEEEITLSSKKTLLRKCYAWSKSSKAGKDNTEHRLVTIDVEFFPTKGKSKKLVTFSYQVFVSHKS